MDYIEMSKECESCRVHNDDPDCKFFKDKSNQTMLDQFME
jgi:hypothetical protein